MSNVARAVCTIRPMMPADAASLLDMRTRNKDFFEPWEPDQSAELYTLEGMTRDLEQRRRDWAADRRYSFLIEDDRGACIGGIILSNVIRGAFQNATVGYYVDEAHNGLGVASEALRQIVRFAFEEIGLHRVEASVMDHNHASKRVISKAGLRHVGFANRYLKLAGKWRDHHLFAITLEEWKEQRAG